MFSFETVPPIGTTLRLDAQEFRMAGLTDHINRLGEPIKLLTWVTNCADCGDEFHATSKLASSGLSRRCAKCRKPGKPVSGKFGKVEVLLAC